MVALLQVSGETALAGSVSRRLAQDAMKLTGLIQHHLDGVFVLAELVSFALLASARSPRASLDSSHLLGAVLVVMTLIFPLFMAIMVVMSALVGCRLGLASGRRWLDVLHPCGEVG
jgi:hypothetical protein